MTRDMNLAGDGKLDYFFNQWVYGTDIPTLGAKLEATDIGGGKYRISGTITQAGVPADSARACRFYLDFGNDTHRPSGIDRDLTGADDRQGQCGGRASRRSRDASSLTAITTC